MSVNDVTSILAAVSELRALMELRFDEAASRFDKIERALSAMLHQQLTDGECAVLGYERPNTGMPFAPPIAAGGTRP